MKKGIIHIYTGTGKGKTTASVGLAVRAKSRGLRVVFAQFMKNVSGGELTLLQDLSIDIRRFKKVLSPLFNPKADISLIRKEALKSLEQLKSIMKDYDVMILDEFTNLIPTRLLNKNEVLDFISFKPRGLELILTGRGAPSWLIDMGDIVTDMKEVKHPLKHGQKARKGIEF